MPKPVRYALLLLTVVASRARDLQDGGYFGIYNASWRETWTPTDPRLVALENALDRCTSR